MGQWQSLLEVEQIADRENDTKNSSWLFYQHTSQYEGDVALSRGDPRLGAC